MPLRKDVKKVLVIGSGPIVIGQAAEFDYAGTQACRALKAEGLEVVLVNPNPATIMTDKTTADHIYIEPLTVETLKRIILDEKPDSLLSTLGGQSGLTLGMQLAKEGFLDAHGVKLLGADLETIDKAEDRKLFKETMESIGEPCIPSDIVYDLEAAVKVASEIGYPVIVRPAFTLGGTGGGIAKDEEELRRIAEAGLRLSPITQVLIEKCISGWKEIEFEAIRDNAGNSIAVCSMENLDPVGVHTGDSIVIAPAVTLSNKEYQMLRSAALNIVESLKINGGCNCQFALHPTSMEYAVIEVNPRVSRSSALASKATGYPIARVASLIAVGYNLDEIQNAITQKTFACFEPTVDYCVLKVPKWPFDKFVYAKKTLGTQMKATGEVMSIATNFEQALMKAVRGCEIGLDTLTKPSVAALTDAEVFAKAAEPATDERIFIVYEAIKRGMPLAEIHEKTMIDMWFLSKLANLAAIEKTLAEKLLTDELYKEAKKRGFLDKTIERLSGKKVEKPLMMSYKMVDTCAGEFSAETPYFYSTFDEENEAAEFKRTKTSGKNTVIVFGSGPIRIGQGIEFDYASVHCVKTLKKKGYDVVLVNNNPETVSTDYDTADRLYFEPLTPEDVKSIIAVEKPVGVVVAFGGQTAIKLTKFLASEGVNILGTSSDSIDAAEDRERFDEIIGKLGIKRAEGMTVMTEAEALAAAKKLGYPVLMRPSYVLGGQNMIIAFSDDDIREYMKIILATNIENPVLIDKYLMGVEVEVDAVCDGEDILIPGIMEHVERAGIHSGDSIAMYPPMNLTGAVTEKLVEYSRQLALALDTKGLINIQYVIYTNEVYIIEANPRSSRTVPYISKVTGVPVVEVATRAMLGEKLADMGYGTGLYKDSPYVAVKVPVFSFEKLTDVDTALGPEMKSTGEVLGIGKNFEESLYKGLVAAGYKMQKEGGIFVSVKDRDKGETVEIVQQLYDLGFTMYATRGTRKALAEVGIDALPVRRISDENQEGDSIIDLMEKGKIQYVISTSTKGRLPSRDSVKIRRKAVEQAIPCLTSLDTAAALTKCLRSKYSQQSIELVDINKMRNEKTKLTFSKMRGSGNDYLYFNCFEQAVYSPESLAVSLSDRRWGVGADGVVLFSPSAVADAKVVIYNADGSNGEVGGNALRCVCKYLYERLGVKKDVMHLETRFGVRELKLYIRNGEVRSVTGNMGKPRLAAKDIPVKADGEKVVDKVMKIGGKDYRVTCVSFGNPHAVVFTKDVESLNLEKIGPQFENSPLFPNKVNVSFVNVTDECTLRMRVWERGIGETMSCGTGACAAAVAACLNGYADRTHDITVKMRGGNLIVNYATDEVFLTGDAKFDFEGTMEI